MWDKRIDTIDSGRVRRVSLLRDGKPASFAEVIKCWQGDDVFRAFFIGILAEAPFDAYFWETPPITRSKSIRPFEFVLNDSPALAKLAPDPKSFARLFEAVDARAEVAAFANLGGDAFLVAPCPRAPPSAYAHLAAFARSAPAAQQHAFWHTVGSSLAARLADSPIWLSTSGLGVAWLHARIDSWPKYYTFAPYRENA